MNRLDSLRLSLINVKFVFGLLTTDIEEMHRGQGRIYVDFTLGTVTGVCLSLFHATLGKMQRFVGLAEVFPPHLQNMVEALLARVLPPFLELERLMLQMHEVEKSIITSAAMMSPDPWTVLEPTDALLKGLVGQTLAKLRAFAACVSVNMFAL